MIVDVRDYRMVPGKLDLLLERFEGLFMDEQERLGAQILGIFRDAEDPDRFVWLRGMPDMPTRQRVLTDFYVNGEMWREHREAVNTWLVDSDDVLLVRPLTPWGTAATGASAVGMYSAVAKEPLTAARTAELERQVPARVEAAGGRMLVTLATTPLENNFPRHPIRTGEYGLLWFATFPAPRRLELDGSIAQRVLTPTARSRMR
jgi:hypothetical protein